MRKRFIAPKISYIPATFPHSHPEIPEAKLHAAKLPLATPP